MKKILFVGNFFRSSRSNIGYSHFLVKRLEEYGYGIITVSGRESKVLRLLDMITTIVKSRKEYDIVCCDIFSGRAFLWGEVTVFLAKMLKKKVVLTIRGGQILEYEKDHRCRVVKTFRRADVVVSVSRQIIEGLSHIRNDIVHLPNAVSLANYGFRRRDSVLPNIVWLRGFHEIYRPELAIEVFEKVSQRIPEAKLFMAGAIQDDSFKKVEDIIKRKNLKNIDLSSQIEKERVPDYLNKGDIFLNTTKYESFGVAVMEAAACGMCIVTADVGELPHIWVDGESAVLCGDENAEAMADAIVKIIREPRLAGMLSMNARATAERYSWENILPRWKRLLGEPGVAN